MGCCYSPPDDPKGLEIPCQKVTNLRLDTLSPTPYHVDPALVHLFFFCYPIIQTCSKGSKADASDTRCKASSNFKPPPVRRVAVAMCRGYGYPIKPRFPLAASRGPGLLLYFDQTLTLCPKCSGLANSWPLC